MIIATVFLDIMILNKDVKVKLYKKIILINLLYYNNLECGI